MGGKKKMLQSCATELSELCERLEKEFCLPAQKVNNQLLQGVLLQGDVFQISYGIEADGHERITYKDRIATASFSDSETVFYSVKGKYLSGQKQILKETYLGRRILGELDSVEAELCLTEEQRNRSSIVARTKYQNTGEVYDFIKQYILS